MKQTIENPRIQIEILEHCNPQKYFMEHFTKFNDSILKLISPPNKKELVCIPVIYLLEIIKDD